MKPVDTLEVTQTSLNYTDKDKNLYFQLLVIVKGLAINLLKIKMDFSNTNIQVSFPCDVLYYRLFVSSNIRSFSPRLCFVSRLDSLKEVYRARQAELRRMEGDAENAKSSLELLEESSSEAQLRFYRTMILYVHNLVECLQEKV